MDKIKEMVPHNSAKYIKYKKQWEKCPQFKGWLAPLPGNNSSAFCKVCRRPLYPSKKDLIKHSNSKKHKLNYARNLSFKEYGIPSYDLLSEDTTMPTTSIKCETLDSSLLEETELIDDFRVDEKQSITIKLFPSKKVDDENMQLLDESFSMPEDILSPLVASIETMQTHPQYKDWLRIVDSEATCIACRVKFKCTQIQIYKHSIGKIHLEKCAKKSIQAGSDNSLDNGVNALQFPTDLSFGKQISIDLRSDTVTLPTKQMKDIMLETEMETGIIFDNENVIQLQEKVARLLNMDEGLIFPSGTMANIAAVMTHCWSRDSEVIMGSGSQLYIEASAPIVKLCSIPIRTLNNHSDGTFCLDELKQLIKPTRDNKPSTSLICIENPLFRAGGKVLPINWMQKVTQFCEENDTMLHMDGSRLLNASIACGRTPDIIVQSCDSSTFCLDKGLGTPGGSVLVGSHPFISRAKKIRNILGGSLQQSGMFAVAALHAMETHTSKLSMDHSNARKIAQYVKELHSSAITVEFDEVQTNIVHLHTDNIRVTPISFCERLSKVTEADLAKLGGVKVSVLLRPVDDRTVQLVTHIGLSPLHIDFIIKKLILVIQEYDSCLSTLTL